MVHPGSWEEPLSPPEKPPDQSPVPEPVEPDGGSAPDDDEEEEAGPPPTHPFEKRRGEKREMHRALLLYAMQDPDRRSLRLVARALARNDATVRYWQRSRDWTERINAIAATAQPVALRMYRELYVGSASRLEIEVVRPNISIPLIAEDPHAPLPPPESMQEGRYDARLAPGDTGKAPVTPGRVAESTGTVTPAAAPRHDPRNSPEAQLIRKGIVVYDAVIGQFARQLSEGKVKVSARDMPFIIGSRRKLQKDLERLESGETDGGKGPVEIPESFRVKHARLTGANVIAAAAEDARDLFFALNAIANQSEADADFAARVAAQSRATATPPAERPSAPAGDASAAGTGLTVPPDRSRAYTGAQGRF